MTFKPINMTLQEAELVLYVIRTHPEVYDDAVSILKKLDDHIVASFPEAVETVERWMSFKNG